MQIKNKKWCGIILSILSILLMSYAITFLGADFQNLMQEGERYYRLGIEGNKRAVNKAISKLEKALEIKKNDPLTLVFLGSCYTLKARDAEDPWKKMKWVNKGLKFIDQAVKVAPENFEVRKERVLNNLCLPSFLNRDSVIKSDLEFLISRLEAERATVSLKQMVYFQAGNLAERLDSDNKKAYVYWNKVIELNEKSSYAQDARKKIAEVSQ